MRKVGLAALWVGIVWLAYVQIRAFEVPFDRRLPRANLRLLLHKKKPKVDNIYVEQTFDDALAEWKLTGPIHLALPPMYGESGYGNAGFLSSFVNHGEVMLYNEPYPHPKLSITEHHTSATGPSGYQFDNRSTNAAFVVGYSGGVWPFGYTAWYDFVMRARGVDIPTPQLVDASGAIVNPTAARATNPLNRVELFGDVTRVEMKHWSPIIWFFPGEGRLRDQKEPGFVIEPAGDGATMVSYLPSMPLGGEHPFGLFLLSQLVTPTDASEPSWWPLDEQFRRAVVDGRPVDERRKLFRQLAAAYRTHPLLTHYRIIAELGGDRFDDTWLRAQTAHCELPSWYLVAWTHVPWAKVRKLPCLTELPAGRVNGRGEYIAESVVLAYRDLRDDGELQELAARVVARSFLRNQFRAFNYPLSNFAWLWLKARL